MALRDPLTMKEASKLLGLDETTLRHMAEDRQIPAVKVGTQWVFSRKSLQKWQDLRARRAVGA